MRTAPSNLATWRWWTERRTPLERSAFFVRIDLVRIDESPPSGAPEGGLLAFIHPSHGASRVSGRSRRVDRPTRQTRNFTRTPSHRENVISAPPRRA